jgi:RNA polymerase sigma-70 factor, ECF subfamily
MSEVRPTAATNTEFLLVHLCLQGDAAAWETVVSSYRTRISRMAYRYRNLRNDAEDVTQEVFFRVFRNLATFRADSGSLENWVVRVGRNLLIDHFRASRRFRRFGGSYELESLKLKDERCLPPDRSLEGMEDSEALMAGLQSLQSDLKEAVVLRYIEGMSYQEIARRLGVPQGTIKSRINRGRAKLATLLACRARQKKHH